MSQPFQVVIDRLGAQGDGIALQADGRLFVDGALPGERVLVRMRPLARAQERRAELLEILQPSPERVAPPCIHAGLCGGCRLQHLDLAAFARFLADKVRTALSSRGLDGVDLQPAELSPPGSRRRLRLAWRNGGGATVLGLRMAGSNRIVDLATCLVADPRLVAALPRLRALAARLSPATGEIALDLTDVGLDLLVIAAGPANPADRAAMARALPELTGVCRVSWRADGHTEPLLTQQEPYLVHGPVRVPLAPGAFRQATAPAEAAIRRFLNTHLAGSSHVVDLFGGSGALGLALAPLPRRLQVVEADAAAVDALARGLRGGVKGSNVTVQRRDLFAEPLTARELRGVDAVILDPPRAGASAQALALAAGPVPAIAYVSCDPGSFARDARILVDGGYRLGTVLPIGQFLWSHEVELAASFRRDPP